MEASEKFSAELGTAPACRAFGVPRATLYRRRQRSRTIPPVRKCSHRTLSELERQRVLGVRAARRTLRRSGTGSGLGLPAG